MRFLHMAEATDLLGHAGDLHGERVTVVVEALDQLLDDPLIVGNELPLALALRRVAEDVELRAAQPLHPRQQAEGAEHPRAEAPLLVVSGLPIARAAERRRQV